MSMTPATPPVVAPAAEPEPDSSVRSRTGMVRVGVGLGVLDLGWTIAFAAASGVLLATKIATLYPDDKVPLLAGITISGSVVALLANVFFGALSDRTRTRFGSRTPFIVFGAIAAGAAMFALSFADTYVPLLIIWCLYQAAQNAIIAPSRVWIADRVPANRRGTITTVASVGSLIGFTGGAAVGARFITDVHLGMLVFAAIILILPVAGVLIAPDLDNRDIPRKPLKGAEIWSAFSFPRLRGAHDFYWALFGRFLLILGYYMVNGYVLYILTDYIKLSLEEAAGVISVGALLSLGSNLLAATISGPVSDKMGRRKPIIFVATVIFAVAISIPLVFPSALGMLLFYAIGGFGFGAYTAVDGALITQVLPDQGSRGKDLGILNTSNTLGQILAPVASAGFIGFGIGYVPVFVAAILVCLVGAVAIIPIKQVR
ncbi:MFS transporter [Rathayibacter sp. VKM Ac-2801]|uniref:MFS transporter n=1 Tax=Rathayibacter sp. VKM Ac-2801 TaxID=2609255 RepID=UPI0013202E5D|nr:MFS transporter [Rathayibacter sp. VKM Ac-2801]QHC69371.1 MFS transporter [Rathayibacter sp. VKM Ac-2801]